MRFKQNASNENGDVFFQTGVFSDVNIRNIGSTASRAGLRAETFNDVQNICIFRSSKPFKLIQSQSQTY